MQSFDIGSFIFGFLASLIASLVAPGVLRYVNRKSSDIWVRILGGTLIAGKWKTSYKSADDDQWHEERATLYQRGGKVTGDIVLRKDDKDIPYCFSGTFRNNILSGTYYAVDKRGFERGTILLRYLGKKKTFVGQNSFLIEGIAPRL